MNWKNVVGALIGASMVPLLAVLVMTLKHFFDPKLAGKVFMIILFSLFLGFMGWFAGEDLL